MLWNDEIQLDMEIFPLDIIRKGQITLGLDYIDIVDYLQKRGFKDETINYCFSTFAGETIKVTD